MSALLSLILIAAATPTVEVRVEGEGYLRFSRDGRAVYAREAELTVSEGKLAHASGAVAMPRLGVGAGQLAVESDGTVKAAGKKVGRIALTLFGSEAKFREVDGLLVTESRGRTAYPGQQGAGTLAVEGKSAPKLEPKPTPKPQPMVPETSPQLLAYDVLLDVKAEAEVEGDTIRLIDLVELTGSDEVREALGKIEMGTTPPIAGSREVQLSQLQAKTKTLLADQRVEWAGASKVVVKRAGQDVSHEQFVEAAEAAARKVVGDSTLEMLSPAPAMRAPAGELELVAGRPQLSRDEVTVSVALFVAGKRVNSRQVKFRYECPAAKLRTGQSVTVRVRTDAVSIEVQGKVKSISVAENTATVHATTGAELTGVVRADGTVEVNA